MDLLKLFTNLAGMGTTHKWRETAAVFTGVSVDKDNNILDGSEGVPSFAYEIRYNADGRNVTAWYMFPNQESPDPRQLAGTSMNIRYRSDKPDLFEKI